MTERQPIHRYPKWLAWPLELAALLLILPTTWNWVHVHLQVMFRQWPQTLAALGPLPYVERIAQLLARPVPPGPVPWEELYPLLLKVNGRAFILFLLAALLRSFLPQLRVREQGLQARRGLGWATVPWARIALVHSMSLASDRLVLLVQGRRLPVGFWFRFYSLLWWAGLAKGIVVTWHISEFDTLAQEIVRCLQGAHGEQQIGTIVDDSSYSFLFALLFQPRETWRGLFSARRTIEDAYSYPKWVHGLTRTLSFLLLVLAIWRYLGVCWRYLAGRFPALLEVLGWPVLGPLFRLFGSPVLLSPSDPAAVRQAALALLAAQVSMALVLVGVIFLRNLFPNWLLGAEGISVRYRKGWLRLPWESIRSLRETLFSESRGVALLQVGRPGLTRWHTLYSLVYGAGRRRGVLFSSILPGFHELRQRIRTGAQRTRETGIPGAGLQAEEGEQDRSDLLAMTWAPVATLRQIGEAEEAAAEGSLLKRPGAPIPSLTAELPWEKEEEGERPAAETAQAVEQRRRQRATARTAVTLAAFPLLLVLLEEWLFLPLSRPLALFTFRPVALREGPLPVLLLAVLMGLLFLMEWPFQAAMTSTVAEMYEQPGEFGRAFALYPHIQAPRIGVGLVLLVLGATGLFQPLFLIWWVLAGVWGALLLWLAGRELYGWRGLGNGLLVASYSLYQALVLVIYLLFH